MLEDRTGFREEERRHSTQIPLILKVFPHTLLH